MSIHMYTLNTIAALFSSVSGTPSIALWVITYGQAL